MDVKHGQDPQTSPGGTLNSRVKPHKGRTGVFLYVSVCTKPAGQTRGESATTFSCQYATRRFRLFISIYTHLVVYQYVLLCGEINTCKAEKRLHKLYCCALGWVPAHLPTHLPTLSVRSKLILIKMSRRLLVHAVCRYRNSKNKTRKLTAIKTFRHLAILRRMSCSKVSDPPTQSPTYSGTTKR